MKRDAESVHGYGRLGFEDTKNRNIFTEIPNVPKDIITIGCGGYYTVILKANNTLMCTGKNFHGQLGLGDYGDRTKFETNTKIDLNSR